MAEDIFALIGRLIEDNARLKAHINRVEGSINNMFRPGKVTDVDTKKHRARIEVASRDGKITKSAWVPYGQIAGDYKQHRPPTKGQQMMMMSPDGEFRQAMLMPLTWSDDVQSPSEKEDEHVTTYGKLKIVEKGDAYEISLDKASLKFSPGKITMAVEDAEFELTAAGYTMTGNTGVLAVSDMLFTGVDDKTSKAGQKVMTEGGPALKHKSKA